MSEFSATIDAYFDDLEQQQRFIELLENKKSIEIEKEIFSIQGYVIADVINFTLWAGGHDQSKLITKWLSSLSPKYSIVDFFSDDSAKRLAFENGKKKAMKSVVKELSFLSKSYEAGLIFQGGVRKAITYLKNNDVDVTEIFQGQRHIDRIFDNYDPDHETKIFELLIEQGKITTDLNLDEDESNSINPALFSLNIELAIQVLQRGGDPNTLEECHNGDNLLSGFFPDPSTKSLKQLNTLLALGVDVHHKNNNGIDAIQNFFKFLDTNYSYANETEELYLLDQLKVLIKHGATPYFIDKNGFGCLFYAKWNDLILGYLKENFEGLKVPEDSKDYVPSLLRSLGIKNGVDNKSGLIYEYIRHGLNTRQNSTSEFRDLFLNPMFLDSKAKLLDRIIEYLDLTLNLDSDDLLNLLCKLGIPVESVFTYSSYYDSFHFGVAKIQDTINIKKYLEDRNIFDDLNERFESKNKWCDDNIIESDDFTLLAKYCSEKWQEELKRVYAEQGRTSPIGSYLSYHLKCDMQRAARSWNKNIWISRSAFFGCVVIEKPDKSYKIITIEEAFQMPEFNVLIELLDNKVNTN